MIDRARNTFPEEDVYYKLLTTEEYVALIVTTKKKQNVCFDRYVPVHGSIGEEETGSKLAISMVSDTMQRDDIFIIIQGFFCPRHRNVNKYKLRGEHHEIHICA